MYKKERNEDSESIAGEWINGKFKLWGNTESLESDSSEPDIGELTQEQIQRLYEEYMELLELEVNVFGVKPTEIQHLIGRIGEFKCALLTQGALAHVVNQHGFDVISKGRKISVKTTAQKAGFVSLNLRTLGFVDDLMVLQYSNNEFKIINYGSITPAIEQAREFNGRLELDISKAKRINA